MMRFKHYIFFIGILVYSSNALAQDNNTVELHIQMFDKGICIPLLKSNRYSTSRFRETKTVFESGSYYSTMYAYVNSSDSADLMPEPNHELQASSIRFKSSLEYELVFLRLNGFKRSEPDSMVIKISKLDKDAQLILPFKKGKFVLKKMKLFKKLKPNEKPNFISVERKAFKNNLKLDSTSYFYNGNLKAKFYAISENFPLFYVQEFDSINSSNYSQGYHLLTNYKGKPDASIQPFLTNAGTTKYGYWEYFEKGKRVKHELWASRLQQEFEWYPSGQLKFATYFGQSNMEAKHVHYLENGAIKEEFHAKSQILNSFLKTFVYNDQGKVILINTFNSSNGLTKQDLQKRELFYSSGQLKMKENYVGTYTIKYYNEDGTERIN